MYINQAPFYSNISELRKKPSQVIKQAQNELTAIFNHGDLVSYLVPPAILNDLLEIKADKEALDRIAKMDLSQAIDVDINEL
ncbi:hypothetical protein SPONN_2059 [uncultured Candidatus Thioglobus sp.]|nr:hypothetical protein SPONL_263 [uncultured Candidatus Thioglobus sp.]SMN00949.1 hypothetical protein SPONN_2059 [uncultured Candidatus Thioglobus sp.]